MFGRRKTTVSKPVRPLPYPGAPNAINLRVRDSIGPRTASRLAGSPMRPGDTVTAEVHVTLNGVPVNLSLSLLVHSPMEDADL